MTCLIDPRRQSDVAHPPVTRPTGFADQDLLAGKGSGYLLANVIHMRGRIFGTGRKVLPIGQEMNGDEIDIGADLPVAQPEFPDVGVGHRHIDARFNRADDFPKVGYDHLSP